MNSFQEKLLKDAAALREGQTKPAKDESLAISKVGKLTEFQQKLIDDANAFRVEKPVVLPSNNTPEFVQMAILKDDDESLKAVLLEKIDSEIAELVILKSAFANSLIGFADDDNEGRKGVIDSIELLQVKIDTLNASRNGTAEVGTPVEIAKSETSEKVLDFKAIANLKSQLSKAKKALEKNPDNLKIKVKIAEINEKLGK